MGFFFIFFCKMTRIKRHKNKLFVLSKSSPELTMMLDIHYMFTVLLGDKSRLYKYQQELLNTSPQMPLNASGNTVHVLKRHKERLYTDWSGGMQGGGGRKHYPRLCDVPSPCIHDTLLQDVSNNSLGRSCFLVSTLLPNPLSHRHSQTLFFDLYNGNRSICW